MAVKPLPSLEYLNQCFVYDEVNGGLIWKIRSSNHYPSGINQMAITTKFNTRFAGKPAGSVNINGYRNVYIKGGEYKVHRIVWAMCNNKNIPDGFDVDHIDGDKTNNRADNLRLATTLQNQGNAKKRRDNTTGFKGVSIIIQNNKYRARININGKSKYLGEYFTPEEAHAAYLAAAEKHFGKFARGK